MHEVQSDFCFQIICKSCKRIRKVKYVTSKLNLRKWLNTAEIVVEHVGSVRDWKSWLFVCILRLSFEDLISPDICSVVIHKGWSRHR